MIQPNGNRNWGDSLQRITIPIQSLVKRQIRNLNPRVKPIRNPCRQSLIQSHRNQRNRNHPWLVAGRISAAAVGLHLGTSPGTGCATDANCRAVQRIPGGVPTGHDFRGIRFPYL